MGTEPDCGGRLHAPIGTMFFERSERAPAVAWPAGGQLRTRNLLLFTQRRGGAAGGECRQTGTRHAPCWPGQEHGDMRSGAQRIRSRARPTIRRVRKRYLPVRLEPMGFPCTKRPGNGVDLGVLRKAELRQDHSRLGRSRYLESRRAREPLSPDRFARLQCVSTQPALLMERAQAKPGARQTLRWRIERTVLRRDAFS